mgnify:CR=1 FL=1
MNPIDLTVTLIPIKTEVVFGNPDGPIRKIQFALGDEPNQEIVLSDSYPGFDDIWNAVAPDIKIAPPDPYISKLYERYQG